MISFAQAREDVFLWRALASRVSHEVGFWIDVGAYDPEVDSVTHEFHRHGWRGINVEPVAEHFEKLKQQRPRDINIQAAVSDRPGEIVFHEIVGHQLGTVVDAFADRHAEGGLERRKHIVPAVTLTQICEQHAPPEIHFLKIDVEGHEGAVIAGMDFTRFRPWILIVEATEPNNIHAPTYADWDPVVQAAGYTFAYTDLLNRYYVAEEHPELLGAFALPPDEFLPAPVHCHIERLERIAAGQAGPHVYTDMLAAAYQHRPVEAMYAAVYGGTEPIRDYPVKVGFKSSLCQQIHFSLDEYRYWMRAMKREACLHRKHWEWFYIAQALFDHDCLQPGKRGLVFAVGQEPLPALFAHYGCDVLASDQAPEQAARSGWSAGYQYSSEVETLFVPGVCDRETFDARVGYVHADMNDIPSDFAGRFDFCWSSCAFEHLGSLEHGLTFVERSLDTLVPGGIAVHTTEFNLSSNDETVESEGCSIYRRRDIEDLVDRLTRAGHEVVPIDWNMGSGFVENLVDLPPYRLNAHVRLRIADYDCTSIGLIIRKGGGSVR